MRSSSRTDVAESRHRLRLLREEPYTQKEAEAAVGLRTDNGGVQRSSKEEVLTESMEIEV